MLLLVLSAFYNLGPILNPKFEGIIYHLRKLQNVNAVGLANDASHIIIFKNLIRSSSELH